jgi:hypothetical protein
MNFGKLLLNGRLEQRKFRLRFWLWDVNEPVLKSLCLPQFMAFIAEASQVLASTLSLHAFHLHQLLKMSLRNNLLCSSPVAFVEHPMNQRRDLVPHSIG